MTKLLLISSIILLAGCTSAPSVNDKSDTASDKQWTPPAAGTIVVADSMKVADDSLNNTYFSVSIRVGAGNTGKPTDGFAYDLHATYGHAVGDGKIIMPFGGEHLQPVLRKGDGYSYVMGFVPGAVSGGDMTFHEYYRITGDKEYIRIIPLKGYKIQ